MRATPQPTDMPRARIILDGTIIPYEGDTGAEDSKHDDGDMGVSA